MAASRKVDGTMLAAVIVLCSLATLTPVSAKSKYISISLESKWKHTPILLEASEGIAKESSDYFWTFINDLSNLGTKNVKAETDESQYHLIQKLASKVLSPLQLNLLRFTLALRAHSPTIQMYQQIAAEADMLEECDAFVDVHGSKSCDPSKLDQLIKSAKERPKPAVYSFDHLYPGSDLVDTTVILYAEVGTESFTTFHTALSQKASERRISYVLRHFLQNQSESKVRLAGYGLELAIKSTEYKAKDDTKVEGHAGGESSHAEDEEEDVQGFIFNKLKKLHPELTDNLKEFRDHLIDSNVELAPLDVWQLQDLSLQAAQRVLSAPTEDALRMLVDISQNFPSQARSLVKTTVDNNLKKEIQKNQQNFEADHSLLPGDSALYLNGLPVDLEIYDIFSLLEVMRSEARVLEGLHSLGFKGENLHRLLNTDLKGGEDKSYALDIRHGAIQYLNDLEKDKEYKGWPGSIQDILRPTFPGMLRHLRKNIFHLVFIVDPADPTSKELIKMAEAFYVHKAPIRLGIVLVSNSDDSVNGNSDASVAFARAFNFIQIDDSVSRAVSFITDVYEKIGTGEVTAEAVIAEFSVQYPGEDKELVFGDDTDYNDVRKSGNEFVAHSGLSGFPQVLMNGSPLKKQYLAQDSFEEGVVNEILKATPSVQKAVYHGELYDSMNVLDWLMEKDNVLPRLNSRILSTAAKSLDLSENIDSEILHDTATFSMMNARDMASIMADNMKYLTRREEEALRSVSMWVVADLETTQGRQLMYNAIKHLKSSADMRLSMIFNPSSANQDNKLNKAVYTALTTLSGNIAKSFITKLVKEENVMEMKAGTKKLVDLEVHGMDMKTYLAALNKQGDTFLKSHRAFAQKVLLFEETARGIITNGKVIGPLDDGEDFLPDDVGLLEKYTLQQSARKIREQIRGLGYDNDQGSNLLLKVAALLTAKSQTEDRKKVSFKSDEYSVLKIPADDSIPAFVVEVVVDPVSREAQKLSAILHVLRQSTNVEIRLYMNCKDKLSEMPLKNYYRYVLDPELTFKVDGSYSRGPVGRFTDMPEKSLLTLNMDPPESWLVEAVRSPYDLDNILLEEVHDGVKADFELEYILLEGHCHDSSTMQPPRGLQFTLGTNSTPAVKDTIVMANLGYFQLKANPGVWQLQLREGRSREIYDINSHDFTDTPKGSTDVVVAISSFKSKIIRVKVSKKADKQKEQLLQDSDEGQGLWDSISSSFTGQKSDEDEDETLNIFSLASGHLYERFLRIMMLGVLKNTKSKVKFWFLKNYLSPTVTDFIPHMAKEYGFQYELVQYKWPRWLIQQKEKQRVIWGYKILFLDVLFPLHVKKIIFVDADQIVRADLKELHNLDLGGAPYGYTPFCSDRKEMDGFRFWKSGYWASHLAGRPYHISALYVVDLKRFRRIAAGDRLRGQYQGLSQDPNSLANLDQDLPNNMIHQVSIKSLPQEWLWCETWCSTESLQYAKTIDLCNNPLTKEPKLSAAMRIVPEWKEYDYEIKVLWDKVYGTNTRLQTEYEVSDTQKDSLKKDEL
ncbi:UDP-glucose:glycoprotein glucosyltransferase 1-like isoform X2 [Haliotis cracherodii]|uniref:UDP-glucose:glycoprotein glucosyltransferase 1-like isoform X2 n=1 Tax=Haliotis cracherodii TaxID=6455 RepID=UPI0039ED69E4